MSVHSKDRETWLTKLNRIGKVSVKNRKVVFNNLGYLINADMLKEQYQQLDEKKAVGVDKVTKKDYGENLDENINMLIQRIRRGTYRPKPARIIEIPKEDGGSRPLAISCLEDKLIQLAVNKILTEIYEPLFSSNSYGYRPGKSCHDALRALNKATYQHPNGAIIEIDISKYFNTIPHKGIKEMLQRKISDRRFLRLIDVLMTAPIMEGNKDRENTEGCPQGSIISPILANIYLHHVIDEWFERIKHTHLKGNAELIRFADDMVFSFACQYDARRFYETLPKRLSKFGLQMHPDKSRCMAAGRMVAQNAENEGKRLETFNFLGFTCYWGKAKSGFWRLKYTSRKDRFASKLKGLRSYLRENLNTPDTAETVQKVIQVVKGWVNYHAVSDNKRRVRGFLESVKRILLQWLNRRGGKRRVN